MWKEGPDGIMQNKWQLHISQPHGLIGPPRDQSWLVTVQSLGTGAAERGRRKLHAAQSAGGIMQLVPKHARALFHVTTLAGLHNLIFLLPVLQP